MENIIVYLSYLILGGAIIYSTKNITKLQAEFKTLTLYLCLSGLVQAITEALAENNINNMALSHIYAVLSFVILTRFYYLLLSPFVSHLFFKIQAISFVALALVNVIWWQPLNTFNSIPLTVQALVFIVFSLSTFILTLNEALNHHLRPFLRSLNLINSGIFLYFTGNLLLFYNGSIIIHPITGRWGIYTWLIHVALSIILYICLWIGLWLSPKV